MCTYTLHIKYIYYSYNKVYILLVYSTYTIGSLFIPIVVAQQYTLFNKKNLNLHFLIFISQFSQIATRVMVNSRLNVLVKLFLRKECIERHAIVQFIGRHAIVQFIGRHTTVESHISREPSSAITAKHNICGE